MIIPAVNTLQSVLEQSVSLFGDKVLSTMGSECIVTYRSLGKLTSQLRYFLSEKGVKPGDKVALISENMPHWGVSYF